MNRDAYHAFRDRAIEIRKDLYGKKIVIQVTMDGGSIPAGARATLNKFRQLLADSGRTDVAVVETASLGAMWMEPTVFISKPEAKGRRILYGYVDPDKATNIWQRYVMSNDACPEYAFAWLGWTHTYPDYKWSAGPDQEDYQGIPHISKTDWGRLQQRIVLRHCGDIDPESLEDYVAVGGYVALDKAIHEMTFEEIINQVKGSGLRGRGGAGFAMGIKWESGRAEKRTPKYVIVNGHEGEPNVFKDRRIFEGDPHSVLEGLIIGCFAVGTPEAYIYVGSEHPLAYRRMGKAVEDARKAGFLGENILGSGFNCDVKVIIAAGAYISGEASAMLYGIQGTRGMPRTKPPRSVEAGLWGQPTVVNNVESFNNAPPILLKGGDWYAAIGKGKSLGTKVISLSGPFKRTCIAEIAFGDPIRDAIEVVGGGPLDPAHPIRAVQTGAVSGGSFPASMFDTPFDIEEFAKWDCLLGSGSFTAYTDQQCIIDANYYILRFNRDESCGKCIPCRVGCEGITEMLWRIMNAEGKESDIAKLEGLSKMVIQHSLCGLGQAAPLSILNLLKIPEFKEELIQHIRNGYCKANVCPMAKRPAGVGYPIGIPAHVSAPGIR